MFLSNWFWLPYCFGLRLFHTDLKRWSSYHRKIWQNVNSSHRWALHEKDRKISLIGSFTISGSFNQYVSKESSPTIPCTTTISTCSTCSKARKKITIFKESFKARVGNNKHLKTMGKWKQLTTNVQVLKEMLQTEICFSN